MIPIYVIFTTTDGYFTFELLDLKPNDDQRADIIPALKLNTLSFRANKFRPSQPLPDIVLG